MDLLRNYPAGYNVLPTANPHDVVNVSLQLALYHLVDMVRPTSTARGTVSPTDEGGDLDILKQRKVKCGKLFGKF